MGKAKGPIMALWNIVSRLYVRLIFSGSRFNFPIISDIHPFSIVLRVSWCVVPYG